MRPLVVVLTAAALAATAATPALAQPAPRPDPRIISTTASASTDELQDGTTFTDTVSYEGIYHSPGWHEIHTTLICKETGEPTGPPIITPFNPPMLVVTSSTTEGEDLGALDPTEADPREVKPEPEAPAVGRAAATATETGTSVTEEEEVANEEAEADAPPAEERAQADGPEADVAPPPPPPPPAPPVILDDPSTPVELTVGPFPIQDPSCSEQVIYQEIWVFDGPPGAPGKLVASHNDINDAGQTIGKPGTPDPDPSEEPGPSEEPSPDPSEDPVPDPSEEPDPSTPPKTPEDEAATPSTPSSTSKTTPTSEPGRPSESQPATSNRSGPPTVKNQARATIISVPSGPTS